MWWKLIFPLIIGHLGSTLIPNSCEASIFGEELIPLAKLVAGQLVELERLAESVGVAKEQRELLLQINEGIGRSTRQIDAIQSVVDRAQGVDPSAVRSVSELNNYLAEMRTLQAQAQEVVSLKLLMSDQAIAQAGLQTDTAYRMGQEMVGVGSQLALESRTASPGRAGQITAAAESAQMLSSGVTLQTLAQIAQLQAMQLELQKIQLARETEGATQRQVIFEREVASSKKRKASP